MEFITLHARTFVACVCIYMRYETLLFKLELKSIQIIYELLL